MRTITLDMRMTAGEALAAWNEANEERDASPAKKAAFWKRYTLLRNRESRSGALAPEPVTYLEGASGPVRHLIGEREPEEQICNARTALDHNGQEPPVPASGRTQPEPLVGQRQPASLSRNLPHKSGGEAPPAPEHKAAQPSRRKGTGSQAALSNPKPRHVMNREPSIPREELKPIASRLRKVMAELGYDGYGGTARLAESAGLLTPTLRNVLNGTAFSEATLRKLESVGIVFHWLRHGTGRCFRERRCGLMGTVR